MRFSYLLLLILIQNDSASEEGKSYFLHENGKIAAAYLNSEREIVVGQNKLTLRQNTWMSYYDSGSFEAGFLAHATKVKVGKMTVEAQKMGADSGFPFDIYFHNNGEVSKIWLARDTKVQVGNRLIEVSKAPIMDRLGNPKLSYVNFHKNGSLAEAPLAKPAIISDRKYEAGTYLSFNERGLLIHSYRENR